MGQSGAAQKTLLCKNCGHTKELTSDIVKELVKKYPPSKKDATPLLSRFKCTICGSKDPELTNNAITSTTPKEGSRMKRQWLSCGLCGGDGGAGGRCPRCFGNGFEPSY